MYPLKTARALQCAISLRSLRNKILQRGDEWTTSDLPRRNHRRLLRSLQQAPTRHNAPVFRLSVLLECARCVSEVFCRLHGSSRLLEDCCSLLQSLYIAPDGNRGSLTFFVFPQRGRQKVGGCGLEFLHFIVEEQKGDVYKSSISYRSQGGAGERWRNGRISVLDINDVQNDIIGAVVKTGLPAYIFHAQLDHEYRPPTRRTVPKGLWFTDIFTLLENRLSVKVRRGEDKQAGYYRPSAFRPISEFLDVLKTRAITRLGKILGGPDTQNDLQESTAWDCSKAPTSSAWT